MWCSEQGTMSCCVERLSERLGSCNAKEETGFDSYTLALYSKSDNTGGWNRKPTIMRQDTQMIWRHTNIHDNIKMYTQSHSGIREYKALVTRGCLLVLFCISPLRWKRTKASVFMWTECIR